MDITQMQHGAVLRGHHVNASANRERKRQQRLLAAADRARRCRWPGSGTGI